MATFLNDHLSLEENILSEYGALNISIVNDLPLFIDPFLLFHSEKEEYVVLHDNIIKYLTFLRDRAAEGRVDEGQLRNWYCFPEVKQNWLGFSVSGNDGAGLGIDFAANLHKNLNLIFSDLGKERITKGIHLEKVCLVAEGVGKDNISDFTTNLIKDFLCEYTQKFCILHLSKKYTREIIVKRAIFSYKTEAWASKKYTLPWINGDYILLTPKDILTRSENWINKRDLIAEFEQIPTAIPNKQLRSSISNYFEMELRRRIRAEDSSNQSRGGWRKPKEKKPTQAERFAAALETIKKYPQIIDYFIKIKENNGDKAKNVSDEIIFSIEYLFINQIKLIQNILKNTTNFYSIGLSTYQEAHIRVKYLKDVIENKGGHRFFYDEKGKAIERERDLHVLFRLVWFGTPSDLGAEANDGRGPVDFKISRGRDKTLVEMKLARNTKLEQNLANQLEIYQKASDADHGIKVIIYYSIQELERVKKILKKLKLESSKDLILIDARKDNKPSASKAV